MGCGEEQGEWRVQLKQAGRTHTREANRNPQRDGGGEVGIRIKRRARAGAERQQLREPCWKKNPWTDLR